MKGGHLSLWAARITMWNDGQDAVVVHIRMEPREGVELAHYLRAPEKLKVAIISELAELFRKCSPAEVELDADCPA